MKVRIVKDWDDPDFFRQTPGGKGIWDGIRFTEANDFICDVLVTLNYPPKKIWVYCRPGGKWLMSQEPPHEFYLSQTKSYKYFDAIYSFWQKEAFPGVNIINLQTSLPWHVGKTYDELTALDYRQLNKSDAVSWITSNLNSRPGHSLRLAFMDYMHLHKFPFHLFGRGFNPIEDKFTGIAPYKYSLAIENFSCNDYWTEKIADCFLSWTMPIYYGCANIKQYFPEQAMILIDPNKPAEAVRIIQDAINADKWAQNLEHIRQARDLVLNKYQFFPCIVDRIRKSNITSGKKKIYFIPKLS